MLLLLMQNQLKMRKNINLLLLLLLAMLFSLSCSENSPEISQIFWQINKYQNVQSGDTSDRLSVFIEAVDKDGIEDLETIYIINDKEELFWKINKDEWNHVTIDGEEWFGFNSIEMNRTLPFPVGTYRVVLIDAAGERAESDFFLDRYETALPLDEFPSAEIVSNNGSKIVLSVSENCRQIWFYKNGMTFLGEIVLDEGSTTTDRQNVIAPEGADKAFLYRYDKINGFGYTSGPYIFKK